MIEATPWGHHPSSLIHDRDRVYGADFATRIAGLGIQSIRTPVRSPLANAHRGAGCANPTPGVPGSHLPLSERYVRIPVIPTVNSDESDTPWSEVA